MQINTVEDIKIVAGKMHDSEFTEENFNYDPQKKTFSLTTVYPELEGKKFSLKFFNVEFFKPINLEKVKINKAIGGVFNDIQIKNNGLDLTILSQDLKINLKLDKLTGELIETV